MRSYDEYCSIAKSLDVVGDRWTLLIVRELALRGPSRYTDLRHGLPGIATNLLADRLRELERAGVIAREEAPPPIATTLFRLTPRGEELRPVLASLTRWGLPLMTDQKPEDAVRSHWLASALEMMLDAPLSDGPPVTVELQTGDQPIVLEAHDGAIHTRLGVADNPDATVTGNARPIMGLLLGLIDLADAKDMGITYRGDPVALDRLRGGQAPVSRTIQTT
ncbi:MAG TPA: winged helix-turn-helix transcriptional regulator [Solirubrobacteraceae bacterium]|nr:winged helix-turn-helix transcriptional regulator [Solirubrobacteraceae bacterium]